jgi:5-methylcytosine-specific restriction protein B
MAKETLTCTINGKRFTIERRDIERLVAPVEPESLRDHGVKINGRIYPVKQVVSLVTGLDRLDFQSMQARSVLQRLGFPLWRSAG